MKNHYLGEQLHYSGKIYFNCIDRNPKLKEIKKMRQWIGDCVHREKHALGEISYNFCSDDYLHDMNVKHLKHDTLTDIITFNLNEKKVIIGDIYISYDRVKENAKEMNLSLKIELSRVMIHGVLHLCGYKDKQKKDIIIMRQKEDYYLSLLP